MQKNSSILIMDIPNSRVTSQSMMNVFDDSITVVNGAHTDANNSNSLNIVNQTDDDNDKMSKMSVKEYMQSVFGSGIKEDTSNLPFTEKVRRFLRSNYVHIAVIILVLLDSFCVTIELITDLEDKSEKFKVVEDIFKYLGFSILCIFVVEISLKILFLFKEFIKSKLEIFDAVIVIVSFVIEVVFMNSDSPLAAIGKILFKF